MSDTKSSFTYYDEKATPVPATINSAVRELENHVKELSQTIACLSGILKPVCIQQITDEARETKSNLTGSPLRQSMQYLCERMADLRRGLVTIIDSLDIEKV